MQDDLVERVAERIRVGGRTEDVARAIIPMVAMALRHEIVDEIDLFRIIRRAGRSDKDKARAVAAAIRAIGVP